MRSSKKVGIIFLFIIAGMFGYSQYAFASQIGVIITENTLVSEDERGTTHNLQLKFDNPSLLMLTAGETEFVVYADDERIGDGTLQSFVLPSLGDALVDGTFQTYTKLKTGNDVPDMKISGVTTYDVLFTSIDIPFVFYPSEDQARDFIYQN